MGWDSYVFHVAFEVGNGTQVRFWHDRWSGVQSLKDAFSDLYSCMVDKDALVSSILVSHLGGDGRSWNMKFLRDFHDWELESATSFLELIYSHLPRGNGCDKPNWQLNGSGVFDV